MDIDSYRFSLKRKNWIVYFLTHGDANHYTRNFAIQKKEHDLKSIGYSQVLECTNPTKEFKDWYEWGTRRNLAR